MSFYLSFGFMKKSKIDKKIIEISSHCVLLKLNSTHFMFFLAILSIQAHQNTIFFLTFEITEHEMHKSVDH